jgi:thiol-disulfide isomerase/thioredoxin
MGRARLVLAVAAAMGASMLAGCAATHDAVNQTAGGADRYVAGTGGFRTFPPAQRRSAPKVAGELLDGSAFEMATGGDVIVLNFWASWCPPCRDEADELEAGYQATRADGVTFLGVDSRDGRDAARAFVAGRVTYPSLFDPAGRIALGFREVPPTALPSTLIIDRRGRIAAVVTNAVFREDLIPLVQQIAAEPK